MGMPERSNRLAMVMRRSVLPEYMEASMTRSLPSLPRRFSTWFRSAFGTAIKGDYMDLKKVCKGKKK